MITSCLIIGCSIVAVSMFGLVQCAYDRSISFSGSSSKTRKNSNKKSVLIKSNASIVVPKDVDTHDNVLLIDNKLVQRVRSDINKLNKSAQGEYPSDIGGSRFSGIHLTADSTFQPMCTKSFVPNTPSSQQSYQTPVKSVAQKSSKAFPIGRIQERNKQPDTIIKSKILHHQEHIDSLIMDEKKRGEMQGGESVPESEEPFTTMYESILGGKHRHQHSHYKLINSVQVFCVKVAMLALAVVACSLLASPAMVCAHSPPRAALNYRVPLAQFANQLMRGRGPGAQAAIQNYYKSPPPDSHQSLLNRQRLWNEDPTVQLFRNNGGNPLQNTDSTYYFYKHASMPTCEQLRQAWLEENGFSRNTGRKTMSDEEKLKQLSELIPREQQVMITKIEPSEPKDEAEQKVATPATTTTDTSFGIIHKSPDDNKEREELISEMDRIMHGKSSSGGGGKFGPFLADIVQHETELEKEKYLNGYNLRSGKQGIKVRDYGPARARARFNGPSRTRQSNGTLFPGVFHDKPVKPSIRLV